MVGRGAQGHYAVWRHLGRRNSLSTLKALTLLIVVSFLAWLLADEVLRQRLPSPSSGTMNSATKPSVVGTVSQRIEHTMRGMPPTDQQDQERLR
jgi:hypothetical protein